MSGWFPFDAKWWPVVAASVPKPWTTEAIYADLRWWADQERLGKARRPGRGALRRRWGATDWEARQHLKAEGEWGSPIHKSSSLPPASLQPPSSPPPDTASANADNGAESSSPPPASLQLPSSFPPHARSSQSTETEVRDRENVGPSPDPVTDLPGWLTATRGMPRESRPRFLALVSKAHTMVFDRKDDDGQTVPGKPPDPSTLKTFADSITKLWTARGRPDVEAFGRELLVVIDAAKRCPDALFAHDIRWEHKGGTDRSRDIATICVQRRFDARLDAARRWRQAGSQTAPPPQPNGNGPGADPWLRFVALARQSGFDFEQFQALLDEQDHERTVAAVRASGAWARLRNSSHDLERERIRQDFTRAWEATP